MLTDHKVIKYLDHFLSLLKYLLVLLIEVLDGNLKRLLEKSITTVTSSNSFVPKVTYIQDSKIALKFEGNSLKQDKISFTNKNVVKFFYCF